MRMVRCGSLRISTRRMNACRYPRRPLPSVSLTKLPVASERASASMSASMGCSFESLGDGSIGPRRIAEGGRVKYKGGMNEWEVLGRDQAPNGGELTLLHCKGE